MKDHGISEFVKALRDGRVYVQVTTKEYPNGEIRGAFRGQY